MHALSIRSIQLLQAQIGAICSVEPRARATRNRGESRGCQSGPTPLGGNRRTVFNVEGRLLKPSLTKSLGRGTTIARLREEVRGLAWIVRAREQMLQQREVCLLCKSTGAGTSTSTLCTRTCGLRNACMINLDLLQLVANLLLLYFA
jgi:hypothetical protein